MSDLNRPILQMRVALTTGDYERLVKFYCDGLGMEAGHLISSGGSRLIVAAFVLLCVSPRS